MFNRTLISVTASILITGASLLAMTAIRPAPSPQPATIDGLPVTDLPGMTVRPPAQATSASRSHDTAEPAVAAVNAGSHSLLSEVTEQLPVAHMRMPYYSFGSVSAPIGKE